MCMGCLANADFVVTSGILGIAGARIGIRSRWPGGAGPFTHEEAAAFLASQDVNEDAPTAQVPAAH